MILDAYAKKTGYLPQETIPPVTYVPKQSQPLIPMKIPTLDWIFGRPTSSTNAQPAPVQFPTLPQKTTFLPPGVTPGRNSTPVKTQANPAEYGQGVLAPMAQGESSLLWVLLLGGLATAVLLGKKKKKGGK